MLHPAARPRGALAGEPGAAGRRAQARPQVRGVRPARGRRAAARQAGHGVQVHAAGADGAGVRHGLDRILHPVCVSSSLFEQIDHLFLSRMVR